MPIPYSDVSWNPITGCSDELPCWSFCWARKMAKRMAANPSVKHRYRYEGFKPTFWPERLGEPLRMRKPRRIAVSFMGDMFHDDVPCQWQRHVIDAANDARYSRGHTFLFLTKRPARMEEAVRRWLKIANPGNFDPVPPDEFWFGTSISDQTDLLRLMLLWKCPGNLWLSIEPQQGPVVFRPEWLSKLGWLTLGGGPFPVHPQWVRDVRDQCKEAGVPFDFKQWGDFRPATEADRGNTVCYPFAPDGQPMVCVGKKAAGCLLDGKEYHELPGGQQ